MNWNVLTGRQMHERARERLDDFAELTVADGTDGGGGDIDVDRYDAVIVGGIPMPRNRIGRASNLKVITSTGVGVDSIDVDAATDYGVLVCNNLGANTRAVAEYTIASMMAVRRRLLQADRDVRDGTWDKFGYAGPELDGQVMGVVGYGAIGRTVLELAHGLGMRAVAFDPYVDEESFGEDVRSVGNVGELFELSDAVGIHAPLTNETRGMGGTRNCERSGQTGSS